jgi:hypothetical protein
MVSRDIVQCIIFSLEIGNVNFLCTIQKGGCFYFYICFNSSKILTINVCWIKLAAKNKKSRLQNIFLFGTKFNSWIQKYKLFMSFLFWTFCVIPKIHPFYTIILNKTTLLLLKFFETILKMKNSIIIYLS